ncbi:MAG: acyl--CoA ligase, partial [Myxococcales bacterium]|nr:acyl--CoA ligase [Myxococcales bacterium]
MSIHVGQILRQAALRFPQTTALLEIDEATSHEVTYAALEADARSLSRALIDLGVAPGESVGLMAGNSARFVASWFAIIYAGCTAIPVPTRSAPREIAQRMVHSSVAVLLVDASSRATAERAAESVDMFRVVALDELWPTAGPLEGPLSAAGSVPAMVLYTSGTTGRPKGVVISHASLLCHTASLVHHTLRLTSSDRVLGVLPLTHSYGFRMTILAPFYAGGTVVLPRRFDARSSLRLIGEEAITWVPAVPTMYAAWAEAGAEAHRVTPPASLVWCLCAGAPLPDEVRLRAESVLGAEIRQGYGMTEATFSTINSPPAPRLPG